MQDRRGDTTVRLPLELKNVLKNEATARGISLNQLINEIIYKAMASNNLMRPENSPGENRETIEKLRRVNEYLKAIVMDLL